jgi:hypothetical protein
MQRHAVALAFWLSLVTVLSAETRKFPYEATVRADNVTLRCGQGKNYYATARLEKGAVLTIHRHDPGGWYMVSPPEGSFSWIAAEHVQVDAPGMGTVTLPEGDVDGAPVWVGSDLTSDHSVRQRVLHTGDAVQILAEDLFQDTTGTTKVYKIVPPAREFRWVKGDFVVPLNESLRREALSDPYSNPLADVTETVSDAPERQTAEHSENLESSELAPTTRDPIDAHDPRAALREIDHHYTDMLELDPSQWEIEELVRSYEGLAASNPQLAQQIQQRLTALETRRKLHAEYRSFAQLSSETTQRDQQLAAQNHTTQADLMMEVDLGAPSVLPSLVQEVSSGSARATPMYDTTRSVPSQPTSVSPHLNGAGVVRRLPNGRYGISTRDGRLLAVLQMDQSVQLERVVGQSMGFIGERSFDPRLGTDLLVVKRMLPIQLQ